MLTSVTGLVRRTSSADACCVTVGTCASRPVVEGVIAATAANPVDLRKERRLLSVLRFDSLITFRLQSFRPDVSEEILPDASCWTDWIVFTRSQTVPFVATLIGVAIRFGGQRRLLALLKSWLSLLMCVPPDVIIDLCGAWRLKRERSDLTVSLAEKLWIPCC